jgi:hypothetical protein
LSTYTNSYTTSALQDHTAGFEDRIGHLRISPRLATANRKISIRPYQLALGFSFGALTEDLLQLHDTGIGADAVHRLRVLEVGAFLENLAVGAIGIMLVGHVALLIL